MGAPPPEDPQLLSGRVSSWASRTAQAILIAPLIASPTEIPLRVRTGLSHEHLRTFPFASSATLLTLPFGHLSSPLCVRPPPRLPPILVMSHLIAVWLRVSVNFTYCYRWSSMVIYCDHTCICVPCVPPRPNASGTHLLAVCPVVSLPPKGGDTRDTCSVGESPDTLGDCHSGRGGYACAGLRVIPTFWYSENGLPVLTRKGPSLRLDTL